jgi:hypothetical protein
MILIKQLCLFLFIWDLMAGGGGGGGVGDRETVG